MSSKIKILLILPDGRVHKISFAGFSRSMREAPLTLTTLAALTPEDLDVGYQIIDGSVEAIPEKSDANIVGISVLTGTSVQAYALADQFKKNGSLVALGGVHVTLMPAEAALHADVIFTGPAEGTWPQFLKDYSNGSYKSRYDANFSPKAVFSLPEPHRFLQPKGRYNIPNTVCATRGCIHSCDFCSITALKNKYQKRSISEVISEIQGIPGRLFAFNDVSLADDPEYLNNLCDSLIPLNKRWGGLATTKLLEKPELVDKMAKSGCRYLLVGFESISGYSLAETGKRFNKSDQYKEFMSLVHSCGIVIQGCFIFGFDHDHREVFQKTIEEVHRLKIDIPRYAILTPYPGTKTFLRLQKENRIISYNWSDYDTTKVVFRPKNMSGQELFDGYRNAYRESYRILPILKRSSGKGLSGLINLVGNLTYRRYVKKLYNTMEITPELPICLM